MKNDDSTTPIWRFNRVSSGIIPCVIAILFAGRPALAAGDLFDMDAIRDPKTLEVKVLQDWHVVQGLIATRQKLVTINVGDMWPGQESRVPILDDNFAEMHHDLRRGVWVAEIELDPRARRIDFFINHRKTVRYAGKAYATYVSSPYTRVETSPDYS